jgi:hypothetical protein
MSQGTSAEILFVALRSNPTLMLAFKQFRYPCPNVPVEVNTADQQFRATLNVSCLIILVPLPNKKVSCHQGFKDPNESSQRMSTVKHSRHSYNKLSNLVKDEKPTSYSCLLNVLSLAKNSAAEYTDSWLGNKLNSGIACRLSYRPTSPCSLAGQYDNPTLYQSDL